MKCVKLIKSNIMTNSNKNFSFHINKNILYMKTIPDITKNIALKVRKIYCRFEV